MKPEVSEKARPANYDFQLINAGGRTINFSEFEGKTVFINIWATWCPPCIAEMPDIHDLYEKIGGDIEFVMISVDNDPATAIKFADRKEFEFPIYFLKNGLPATYESSAIPSTFVLSPNGEIVVEEHGLSKYDTAEFRDYLLSL
jgi:thiol-disulfide isomerase/thioredoxin